MLNHERLSVPLSGKASIDSEAMRILRRIASRMTLRANRRVTYRETMTIVESGLDDAMLDIFITRYNEN